MESWMASCWCEPGASGQRKPRAGHERSEGEEDADTNGGADALRSHGDS